MNLWASVLLVCYIKGITHRESPLSLAKITKTCSSQTISAAGNLSAATQHLPDVERRRCRSILEAGFLSLIPSPFQIDAKRRERVTVALHSTLLVSQGEKGGLWSASPRHSVMKIFRVSLLKDWSGTSNSNGNCHVCVCVCVCVVCVCVRVCSPFCTEMSCSFWPRVSRIDSHWLASGLARSATIRCLHVETMKVEWTSLAMKHGWDRSRKRARTQWARMPLILKRILKLLGGSLATVTPFVSMWLNGTVHSVFFPNLWDKKVDFWSDWAQIFRRDS